MQAITALASSCIPTIAFRAVSQAACLTEPPVESEGRQSSEAAYFPSTATAFEEMARELPVLAPLAKAVDAAHNKAIGNAPDTQAHLRKQAETPFQRTAHKAEVA